MTIFYAILMALGLSSSASSNSNGTAKNDTGLSNDGKRTNGWDWTDNQRKSGWDWTDNQ